jgi:hypothetical protein
MNKGFVYWLKWMIFRHPIAAIPKTGATKMADGTVVQGGTFPFHVEAKKLGVLQPITDAAVALSDPALGTVTVNADGTGGVFTAANDAAAPETMTPTALGVTGAGFVLDITPAPVVVSIVPDSAPVSVAIVAG